MSHCWNHLTPLKAFPRFYLVQTTKIISWTLLNLWELDLLIKLTLKIWSYILWVTSIVIYYRRLSLVTTLLTSYDKIPNRLLKIAANVVAPSLTSIFNQSLVTGHGIFPSDWKLAKVSPIFKNRSKSKSDLNDYRPTSVIPTIAKIFEKIICDQLYQCLNENGLLNSGQSGFR